AVTRRQQHERLCITCLCSLAGTRVSTLGAVVLSDHVDAVALLQFVLLHAGHVVLHDLWRIGHPLGANGRRLHGKCKTDGSRQSGSGEQWTIHDYLSVGVSM